MWARRGRGTAAGGSTAPLAANRFSGGARPRVPRLIRRAYDECGAVELARAGGRARIGVGAGVIRGQRRRHASARDGSTVRGGAGGRAGARSGRRRHALLRLAAGGGGRRGGGGLGRGVGGGARVAEK
eukprot:1175806-Prymnesium_polylepis.1